MPRIRLRNPNNNVKKVELTKLLRNEIGIQLDTAKYTTDELVDNGIVTFEVDSIDKANVLVMKAPDLGVTCELVSD